MQVADAVARESKVLCLDEFFVNDVADAAILNRLFARLWENGLVLVSTSNRAPDSLYEGGLQRNLFLPFIDKLKVSTTPMTIPSAAHKAHTVKCDCCSRFLSAHVLSLGHIISEQSSSKTVTAHTTTNQPTCLSTGGLTLPPITFSLASVQPQHDTHVLQ